MPPGNKSLFEQLTGKTDKLVPYGPANVMLLEDFNIPVMQKVAALEFAKNDIVVCSYPKSGTTWTQAIISMIMHAKDTEPIDVSQSKLDEWLYIEMNAPACKGKRPVEAARDAAPPRLLRTHLSWELLPQSVTTNSPRIVFVHRNLKDVIVSMYHMYCTFPNLASAHPANSAAEFAELFMQDKVHHAPYFHTFKSVWEHRNDPNVHHLSYESLREDPRSEIKRLADFLDKPLTSQQAEQIAHHTDFDNMRQNENLNSSAMTVTDKTTGETKFEFMRKGEVRGWRKHLSEEYGQKIDDWIQQEARNYGLDASLFR
ncbi:hypothetical protein RvY_12170 [Ramazzottius varieornatus]|uniref:Sulfotransferase domain-containing protein n=1 Tax=Ramazzottius varieornatus TaxID=947166 RepID=A0A1D1VKL1_RAMVA|nr:hypothetical protein RvY_12170 [Ramazzottius varieornatus]